MRVFVTGISGFVGGHLARALLQRGHVVAGSYHGERPATSGELAAVETWEVTLDDEARLAAALDGFRPDRVVHLAGLAHVGSSWSRMGEYFQVNVLGTEAVLRAAGTTPVLLASSAEVYGLVPEAEQPIGEERLPAPASPYALTKAAAERLALRAGGLVARSFNLIGPGQASCFALPAFALQLAHIAAGKSEPVLRVGNLEARRDFVHVADGAEAYALLAERGRPGVTYNIASGAATSIRQALDLLIATSGLSPAVALDERFLRPSDVALLCGRAEPLRALGWRPRRGLEQAVGDLWEWSRQQVAAQATP